MYSILPTPQSLSLTDERFRLDRLSIVLAAGQDVRLTDSAYVLQQELFDLLGDRPTVFVGELRHPCIYIATKGETGDGYTLSVTADGIVLAGEGPAGTFYAIQTLRQMLTSVTDRTLQGVLIADAPDLALRGIYHDVTRGKVPTLDNLKALVDRLAYHKINHLQLYIEDAFAFEEMVGIMQPHEVLTPTEIRALDDYCHAHFIELTPSISTFGHLYRLLQSPKYQHLCEYENYTPTTHPWLEKMGHHTLDVSHPDSIKVVKSMIDQFAPLCRSNLFNICCDETFDLCKGKNQGKDVGEAYFGFVRQILDHLHTLGKQGMMWGDIVHQHPERVGQLPQNTIMLNWDYREQPDENNVIRFEQAGVTQVVCPGTSTWNRFIEGIHCATGNISRLARYGKDHGAMGVLTTNWGDFGHVGNLSAALYGLLLGAQAGWNTDAQLDEAYELTFSRLAYGQMVNVVPLIRELASCEQLVCWGSMIHSISVTEYEKKERPALPEVQALRDALARCKAVYEQMAALPQTPEQQDFLLSARGVEQVLHTYLYWAGAEQKPDAEAFLADYRTAWLRDNKPSQLSWVEYTFRSV